MLRAWFACLILLVGCSGSPTRPTPVPSPTPAPSAQPAPRPTVAGTITDTVSGARVGSFSQQVDRLPALLPVSLNGFVTRQAWITSTAPTVDLIPEAGFDLAFYRQFVRGALDGRMDPLRRWTQPPSIYLQRAGLSDATVSALEQAARQAVLAFTGGRYGVTTWETGQERRNPQSGWIVVELRTATGLCGETAISGGDMWLNVAAMCAFNGQLPSPRLFAHEIGHALGFWHVTDADALMKQGNWAIATPSPRERHHAAIAYSRSPGSRDIDQDPSSSAVTAGRILSD